MWILSGVLFVCLFVFFPFDFLSHFHYFSWLNFLFVLIKEKLMERFHIQTLMQGIHET